MKIRIILATILIFATYSISSAQDFPDRTLRDGSINIDEDEYELVIEEEFEDEDAWELYEGEYANLSVDEDDEVYLIEFEYNQITGYTWGLDPEERVIDNVVIQVETEQLSNEDDNGYGVMCRADPSNNGYGYVFYISGDGYVTIFLSEEQGVTTLYEWEESREINQGADKNELIATCIGNHLGFFVNGDLVAEVYDNTFRAGLVGFAASILVEDEDVVVAFDDLLVWEVFSEVEPTPTPVTTFPPVHPLSDEVYYLNCSGQFFGYSATMVGREERDIYNALGDFAAIYNGILSSPEGTFHLYYDGGFPYDGFIQDTNGNQLPVDFLPNTFSYEFNTRVFQITENSAGIPGAPDILGELICVWTQG